MWGGLLPRGMPLAQPCRPHLLLLLLMASQPQAPLGQVMDFLFEKWKLYGDQCRHNLSLLPPPTELVCNRTFDKYSCWPDTPPNTTANISCPWYLPWHHKVQHRLVFKRCGPDGQWVRGPRGQPWRDASQCQMGHEEMEVQEEVAAMYSSFQAVYTVGYSLSLGALLLALATLLGLSKLRCTRNYVHANLFLSFALKASSVLALDGLLQTRYSQHLGDHHSVSAWLSDAAVAGCRVAAVFMQYGVVANYCWLLVEGVYLHSLLGLATFPKRGLFTLYLGVGWGAPLLFVLPWAVVKCLFENVQCWTSNGSMAFWWILRFPVFLAILINFVIFVRIVHLLVAKLRARQMRHTDYKFRLAKSTLTLIPLLGVHEVVFAFVTDEQAQGTLRSAKLLFDLFLSSFQGLLVAVLYCFLNKEVGGSRGAETVSPAQIRARVTAGPLPVLQEHTVGMPRPLVTASSRITMPGTLALLRLLGLRCWGDGGPWGWAWDAGWGRQAPGLALPPQVQSELRRRWHLWRLGIALREEQRASSHTGSAAPGHGPTSEKLWLVWGDGSRGLGRDPSARAPLASSLPGLAESPF